MVALADEGILPMIQVHDELDISVENEAQSKRIAEIMEHCVNLEVPFNCRCRVWSKIESKQIKHLLKKVWSKGLLLIEFNMTKLYHSPFLHSTPCSLKKRLICVTIEHSLCEWDKYERVRLGQGRPRSIYRPTLLTDTPKGAVE